MSRMIPYFFKFRSKMSLNWAAGRSQAAELFAERPGISEGRMFGGDPAAGACCESFFFSTKFPLTQKQAAHFFAAPSPHYAPKFNVFITEQ